MDADLRPSLPWQGRGKATQRRRSRGGRSEAVLRDRGIRARDAEGQCSPTGVSGQPPLSGVGDVEGGRGWGRPATENPERGSEPGRWGDRRCGAGPLGP